MGWATRSCRTCSWSCWNRNQESAGRRCKPRANAHDRGRHPRGGGVSAAAAHASWPAIVAARAAPRADRTSTSWLRSNQIRLYVSTVTYVLMPALRRLGWGGTEPAKAQCNTVRLKLLKIGAQIRVMIRKIWVSMSTATLTWIYSAGCAGSYKSPLSGLISLWRTPTALYKGPLHLCRVVRRSNDSSLVRVRTII